ncbi:hypothetical protein [Streptomyces sp. MMBL 11-1]|uniref:hypothetical protein n=1 Tax=Streptomyces sp. MMBL 11-1 TaxID=3026420 RepID=UPI00235F6F92|nr:hypothetical protein [Streptomyces sp. MMBL 11-1]
MLRLIVEAEVHGLVGNPIEEAEEAVGYGMALDTRTLDGASDPEDYARRNLYLRLTLAGSRLNRAGVEVSLLVTGADKVGDMAGKAVWSLVDAALQLMRIPATVNSETEEFGTPVVVRAAVLDAEPRLREARKHLGNCLKRLKQLGY